jgi:hypothetical protein
MSSETELLALIQDLQHSLAKAEEKIAVLEAELEALRTRLEEDNVGQKRATKGKLRSKSMSRTWLAILGHMADMGMNGISIDAIEEHIKARGLIVQRRAIRSQLNNYKSRKLIEQTGDARYRLTRFGRMTILHERHRAEATSKDEP